MASLRPDEEWARHLIAAELGVPVEQHDDGSEPGMHDLDIMFENGRGAAEVTAAADGESIALYRLMSDGKRWIEPRLAGGWRVSLDPTARAKRLWAELPGLLAELERRHVHEVDPSPYSDSPFAAVVRELGITFLTQGETDFHGSIYPTVESHPEAPDAPAANASVPLWVAEFLGSSNRADVRTKLRRSRALERHAFLIVPTFATAPRAVQYFLMSAESVVPDESPNLPHEVTHVWVASTWRMGHGFRWGPNDGWSTFSKDSPAIPPGHASE